MRSEDRLYRWLGLAVFFVGVGLLLVVFFQALALFNAPPESLPKPSPAPMPTPTPLLAPGATPFPTLPAENPNATAAVAIGASLADFVRRLLALLLMCVAGSLVAALGVRMAHAPLRPAPATPPTQP